MKGQLTYPERRPDGLDLLDLTFGAFGSLLAEIGLEILLDLIMFVLEALVSFL